MPSLDAQVEALANAFVQLTKLLDKKNSVAITQLIAAMRQAPGQSDEAKMATERLARMLGL